MDDAVIRLEGLISLVSGFPALAGADLTVQPGEVVLLEGPNGAGKSTLLRVCAGLATVHQGSGVVLGQDVATRDGRRSVRRHVGLLGHQSALYDDLTVVQNLRFRARAAGADEGIIEAVMAELGLGGRLRDVPVRGLSAGQRRRTSLAAVVCRRPRLWLLDEPHAGLDADGRDLVDALVHRAVAAGATALVASHERDRVADLATRVVGVRGGRVVDAPDEPGTVGGR